jgi:hypothetical protein
MRITEIITARAGQIELAFDGGQAYTIDLAPLVDKGGVYRRLGLAPSVRQAKIREDGLYLEWPWGLDIGADSLWQRRITDPSDKSAQEDQSSTGTRVTA